MKFIIIVLVVSYSFSSQAVAWMQYDGVPPNPIFYPNHDTINAEAERIKKEERRIKTNKKELPNPCSFAFVNKT